MKRKIIILLIFLLLFKISYNQTDSVIVEFRGVWVATTKMIDYPSKRYLTSNQLKEEFITMLEMHKENGMNAIIFQIRPAADAFYNSQYEPWSEWLTGVQGKAPDPYFDPLEFMIDETHKLGMEFHAWFNPFRSVATIEYADICSNHISKTKPEWHFTYGINKYLDPGIPEVREYVTKIISDVVTRYEIDGVHFDDYYYPYPEKDSSNVIISIPDYNTFVKYKGNFTDIKDWRRNNMDLFVKMVHDSIKSIKPEVIFGVSPPGVWRNKGYDPEGSNTLGLACYDYLYADILNWLKNDWIDYVAPQIYWYIGNKSADFAHLVDWWSSHNYDKDLYIGIGAYNIDKTGVKAKWSNASEVPNQIRLARKNPNVKGFVFYKTQTFRENPLGLNDSLKNNLFFISAFAHQPKIEFITEYIDTSILAPFHTVEIEVITKKNILESPKNPDSFRIKNEITIFWDNFENNDTSITYNIYKFENETINIADKSKIIENVVENKIVIKRQKNILLFGEKYYFVITTVDRLGNESEPSDFIILKI
jgi:uncharacterized lipoprotein YddW (UPF0748 family)